MKFVLVIYINISILLLQPFDHSKKYPFIYFSFLVYFLNFNKIMLPARKMSPDRVCYPPVPLILPPLYNLIPVAVVSYGSVLDYQGGRRLYKCTFCHFTAFYPSHLRNHMLRHTGKKPHQCTICKKSFAVKYDLRRHFVIHSKNH